MSRQLLDLHEGQVPRPREALVALPGVGRKTANVVLNTGFGEPTIAVDTPHLPRVEPHGPGARQGRARGRDAVAQDGARRVPPGRASLADPARPLHLQGAQAGLPALRDPRPVPVPRQDPRRSRPLKPACCHAPVIGPKDGTARVSGSSPDRRRGHRANHAGKALPLQSPAFREPAVAPPGAICCRLSRQRNIHAIVCASSPPYSPIHSMNLPLLTLILSFLSPLSSPPSHSEIAIDSIAGSDVSLQGPIQAHGNWFHNALPTPHGTRTNGQTRT